MNVRQSISALTLCFAVLIMATPVPTAAQPAEAPAPARSISVATKVTPPFAMQASDGAWSGLAIDLMNAIAGELNWKIRWQEAPTTDDLLKAVSDRHADAAIAAITITSEREATVDFSHPYYDSGLAIAVRRNHGASFWSGLQALTSPAFIGTVSLLILLLFAAGAVIWLIERHRNSAQFESHPVKGIGSGFWWAAVTMTTVGYGDKAPVTPLGRFLAVIWMFAALILTAVFTAQLTTTLTLHRLSGPVTSVADLAHNRVGVVGHTASNAYFDSRGLRTISYKNVAEGLAALDNDEIDAFVHDEPILRYDVRSEYIGDIELLPQVFDAKAYGIALQSGSKLREDVNRVLLEILASPRWTAIRTKYFGSEQDGG
jgi:polar amino acid transport system substrate-binding protein